MSSEIFTQLAQLLAPLAPEICLLLAALSALVIDMVGQRSVGQIRMVIWVSSLAAVFCSLALMTSPLPISLFARQPAPEFELAPSSYVVDSLALSLKALIGLLTALAVWLSEDSFDEERSNTGEYYSLIAFAGLGMMIAVSANEFLTFFIAFELFSIPLYALAAIRRYRAESAEAGLKYFLAGSVSSALMLFGISWVYGSLGTTYFSEFPARFTEVASMPHALLVGVIMILAGLAFKMAAAPFHMWAPDVYEGAPPTVVAYLSSAPKAVIIGFCLRLFWTDLDLESDLLRVSLADGWMLVFAVLSLLSMCLGNLMALPQSSLKRILAYSGIAQIGYLLIGVTAAGGLTGSMAAGATLFYLWVYCLTNLTSWAALLACLPANSTYQRSELAGLAQRSPFVAFVLLISFMSLAGVPPLAGFVGKFYLFRAIYSAGMPWLVVVGVVNSVISLYYYFGVLRTAYFDPPAPDSPPIRVKLGVKVVLVIGTAASLILGLWPGFALWSLETAQTLFVGQ